MRAVATIIVAICISPVEGDEHNGAGGEVHGDGKGSEDDAAERRAEVPVVSERPRRDARLS